MRTLDTHWTFLYGVWVLSENTNELPSASNLAQPDASKVDCSAQPTKEKRQGAVDLNDSVTFCLPSFPVDVLNRIGPYSVKERMPFNDFVKQLVIMGLEKYIKDGGFK